MSGISYNAPATVARFMASPKFGRLIAGPVGSGKTHGCIIELLRRMMDQQPGKNGKRYTRFAIIRQTMPEIKRTVLKDMLRIYEKVNANYKVTDSTVYVEFGSIRSEIIMVPLDDAVDQRRLLSSQLTGAWISECIEIDLGLLGPIMGRIGRYPNGDDGAPTWNGLIADTNFPLEGSDWYDFMENPPPDWEIFKQPGGLTPYAENLNWLAQTAETLKWDEMDPRRFEKGRDYYLRLIGNASEEYINRYVHAQYGTDPSGMAVFRGSFRRSFHVTEEDLQPVAGRTLLIGQDFGRNPWSLICQLDHMGRLLVLEEVPATDVGLKVHVLQNLRPALMDERYIGKPMVIIGDPAGVAKSSLYEENEFDVLEHLGFRAFPAPTNKIDPRLRAVESQFLGARAGGPQILINGKRCKRLVQACAGGYRFEMTKKGIGRPLPDKNEFSHVSDTLQYVSLIVESPDAYARALSQAHKSLGGRRERAPQKAPSSLAWT